MPCFLKFALLLSLIPAEKFLVTAIFCFECNLFPHESTAFCPGKKMVNFGWQYDSCVIYQLRSGSIVYQSGALSNALDGPCRRNLTQLDEMMRKTFTSDIEQQSGVGGKAMCCKSNACNAAIPKIMMKDVNNTSVFLEDYFLTRKNMVMASLAFTSEVSLATCQTWNHLSLTMTTFLAPFFFRC